MKFLRPVLSIVIAVMLFAAIPLAVLAADPPPTVSAITPNSGVNNKSVSITSLSGTGFLSGTKVKLTRTGQYSVEATDVVVVSPTQITCELDLRMVPNGVWNVVVTNTDGQSGTLNNGFTINPYISFEMKTQFPKLEVQSGGMAEFEVTLTYINTSSDAKPKVFDLVLTGPKNWQMVATPTYPKDKRVASIQIDPAMTVGERLSVTVVPPFFLLPDPGEYKVTLQANSGDVKGSIDLIVVVTAKYSLELIPGSDPPRYDTKATAGKEKVYSVKLLNTGSSAVDNITFSSNAPADWAIEFPKDKIDSLAADATQTLDVKIKPPAKAIAGDYSVTVKATGSKASAQDLQIRVTVETPTIWGWVGVAIIVLIIAGLGFIFMRFSRR